MITGSLDLRKPLSLHVDDTIRSALDRIGDDYGQVIVITDDAGCLRGVATMGDLRKAILNGKGSEKPISEAMNREPITIGEGALQDTAALADVIERIKQKYSSRSIYASVPVVAGDGRVLGMAGLESLAKRVSNFVVPAALRRVLVIGGGGYIGSELTRQLLDDGWDVTVLDKFLYAKDSLEGLDRERVTIVRGDVKSIDTVVDCIDGVDAVVYLAELVGDPACSLAPQTALKTNYLAVTALAHLCSYLNINRFVYTSSCSVYGASSDPESFLTENSPTAPVSLYGKIKVLVEDAVLGMASLPNQTFSPTILRLATVFGHSHRPRYDLVVNTFVKEALVRGRIELFGGNQWRPQVHVADVASAIVTVLDAPLETVRCKTFNLGSTDQNHTIAELADFARELFPAMVIDRKQDMVDPRNYRVNCDRIRDDLGFRTKYTVRAGMAEMKTVLESGRIPDPDAPIYSNLRTVQGLDVE